MQGDSPQLAEEPKKIIAGRYRLGHPLGQGTFGQVFYAEDIKFDPPRTVAVKLLHSQFLSDAQSREDIRREASVLARFHHPNILRVSDFEISAEMAYIVTDFAEGGSLAKKLRPESSAPPIPLPLGQVVYYLEQISSALDEAHNLGLIHRDIKPLNILLDRAGRPLLADFGLATALSGSASSMLVDLSASGTPLYMAPEQWAGKAGKASDIYALGVVTYQLITGQPPYQGNQAALWAQHTGAPIPALHEKAPWLDYPPSLDAIIAGAMAKDDRERTRPAGEFARRFKEALMGNPAVQFNNRTQPPAFIQPGPNSPFGQPGTSAPVPGGTNPPPGSMPTNIPANYPTIVPYTTSPIQGTAPLQGQGQRQQTNPPGAPAQPAPGGSVPPAYSSPAWQPGGPVSPPPPPGFWQSGPVAASPPPGGWAANSPPVVTKKKGGLSPALLGLGLGLLVLVALVVVGVLFLLPKDNGQPNQANGQSTLAAANATSTAVAALPAPEATAAALAGTGQLQVDVTESSGKPAREADVTIKVFRAGTTTALDTAYSKASTTFNLKPGSYQVQVEYDNDVKVTGPAVEVKEGQPAKQAINLGLGQVQVEVLEAVGRSARDGDVSVRVYKASDTSKPVTVVYSKAKTGIYLPPGAYQLEVDYANEIKQLGETFQVTEGQTATQSINLQVGTAQVEVYETTGKLARDGDVVIQVHKQDDPNAAVTTVYSKAKPSITLKEGTYELAVAYTDSVKETSGPLVIKAGQTIKQTVNLQVGTAQVEVQLADGTPVVEGNISIKVYRQGNPNDVISTVYNKAKASFILQPGTYEFEVNYTGGKKTTSPAVVIKDGQVTPQIIKI